MRATAAVVAAVVALLLGPFVALAFVVAPPTPGPPAGQPATADIPALYLTLYQRAAPRCPGLSWAVVAAIGKLETDHGRAVAVSSAGALGPMQFLPETWAAYGVDGDGDGRRDVMNPADAIPAAADYLCAHGGGDPRRLQSAVYAYNHSDAYVRDVLDLAARYAGSAPPR